MDVPNLRAANFNVGSEKLDYTTTTQAIQNEAKMQSEKISVSQMKQDQMDRMIKARTAQFQVGTDKNDYSTSVN